MITNIFCNIDVLALAMIFLLLVKPGFSDNDTPIWADAAEVESWFDENVGPLEGRKVTFDAKLATAEAAPKRVTVKAGGGGDFKTITDAVKSVPEGFSHDEMPIPADAAKVQSWFEENVDPWEGRKATLDPTYASTEATPKRVTIKDAVKSFPKGFSNDKTLIPADAAQVESWFKGNVGPLEGRKATLDPKLATAEATPKRVTVKAGGGGDFKTITDAVKSVPEGNTKRIIVEIGPGVYKEKVKIDRTKPFVTFLGDAKDMPTLTYGGTAAEYGTVDSASFIVESDYFLAANVIFANSAPRPNGVMEGAQAVAVRVSGDKSAFYNCKFIGFQDTLCDHRGRHFFKDCVIEGTVDFIFGLGKSLYLKTELNVVAEKEGVAFITAQARQSNKEDTGYSFVHCSVTGTKKNVTYLGRSWMPYPRVVYAYSTMGDTVTPLGWSDNFRPETDKTVFFGEYKNTGPGGEAKARAKYSKQLSESEVAPFMELGFIEGSKWLLPPPS